jgi:uncharacterized protein (TIGR04255 family)
MQVQRHYSKAPIKEAVIDLKVTFPEDFSVDKFADIHARISDRFPTMESIYTATGTFVLEPGSPIKAETNQGHNGFLFRSSDNLRLFQATLGGFTFNRLAPYDSWEEFSSDAKDLWEIYKEICSPTHVIRAAIRYINQINIPIKGPIDLQDYFRIVPEVPSDLPQANISTYFMQLQLPQPDLNCMLIINEALTPQTSPELLTVILDFDLFRQQTWQSDDEDIWLFLEDLRHRKNQVFDKSLTEKAKELFD